MIDINGLLSMPINKLIIICHLLYLIIIFLPCHLGKVTTTRNPIIDKNKKRRSKMGSKMGEAYSQPSTEIIKKSWKGNNQKSLSLGSLS